MREMGHANRTQEQNAGNETPAATIRAESVTNYCIGKACLLTRLAMLATLASMSWYFYVSSQSNRSSLLEQTLVFFLFIGSPAATGYLVKTKSLLTFPFFIFVLFATVGYVSSEIRDPIKSISDPFILLLSSSAILLGACNGAYLFRKDFARFLLRESNKERKEIRQRVDALVRLRLPDSTKQTTRASSSPSTDSEANHICVVVRDISTSGIGLYGFPDDINALTSELTDRVFTSVAFIYREKTYLLRVDCRWWKGSSNKGECGLQLEPNAASKALAEILLEDSGQPERSSLVSPFLVQNESALFRTSLWLYSMIGILLLH